MKLIDRILFPTSLAAVSEPVAEMVAALAKTFSSEVDLLHVIPGLAEDLPIPMDQAREISGHHLDQLRLQLEKEGVTVGATIIKNGVLFDEIVRCAYEQDVNVIVIGSGDASGAGSGAHLGTTAEVVIRKATRPVWVVKYGSATTVDRILCPVDFSPASARALKNAILLSRSFGAELTVLNVIRPLTRFAVYGFTEDGGSQAMEQQEEKLQAFLNDFDFHDVSWAEVIQVGRPHREIVDCARERGIDLLVMGSVGRTGLSKTLLGSVATKVVREVPCSVVTVKTEDVIRPHFEESIRELKGSFAEAVRLMEKGRAKEAKRQFHQCVAIDPMFAPAWEGLAEANRLLGNEYESAESKATAQLIRRQLWEKQVDFEIRLRRIQERN